MKKNFGWYMVLILFALLCGALACITFSGCIESETIDVKARERIIDNQKYILENREWIYQNYKNFEALKSRSMTLLWPIPEPYPLPDPGPDVPPCPPIPAIAKFI